MIRGTLRPLSIAPMMDRTDRHQRVVMRAITRHTLLYTEMVHANAVVLGDTARHLRHSPVERPLSLQLGGSEPELLARAARLAEEAGFDEVNLNVGCPSPRVASGGFGAWLMGHPHLVAECIAAMRDAVSIPVTVKHRIGIDHDDAYEDLLRLVEIVAPAGADRFTVHARKAWLTGLSPKDNRTTPPLRHAEVRRLKAEHPELHIETNGGIRSLDAVADHLQYVDAVMIGRGAVDDPWLFLEADRRFFGDDHALPNRREVVEALLPYVGAEVRAGAPFHHISRHLMPLFLGQPGARRWRRALGEARQPADPVGLVREALRDVLAVSDGVP